MEVLFYSNLQQLQFWVVGLVRSVDCFVFSNVREHVYRVYVCGISRMLGREGKIGKAWEAIFLGQYARMMTRSGFSSVIGDLSETQECLSVLLTSRGSSTLSENNL